MLLLVGPALPSWSASSIVDRKGPTYYVAPDGSDAAPGTAAAPWRTIGRAVEAPLPPGATVVVRPGTYEEAVTISHGGTDAGPVTFRSDVPGAARLRPPPGTYTTLNIRANFVNVEGFDIVGGGGHAIDADFVHHVDLIGNRVHDSGGSGIQFNYSEFILIQNNVAFRNSSTNGYQTSGISVYEARNVSGDTTTPGFRVVVRGNVSYENVETAAISGQHTDGNGIIIDDFRSTHSQGHPAYPFPTLVEGNLVYLNGGKGIQVTWSDHVTVRNNTAWHDNLDPLNTGTWRGELSNAQSSDNLWQNNIGVADPTVNPNNTAIDNTSYGGYVNRHVLWQGNVTFNGTPGAPSVRTDGGNAMPGADACNLLGVDPRFIAPPTDFTRPPGAPAADAGAPVPVSGASGPLADGFTGRVLSSPPASDRTCP